MTSLHARSDAALVEFNLEPSEINRVLLRVSDRFARLHSAAVGNRNNTATGTGKGKRERVSE